MSDPLAASVGAAVDYLLTRQAADGHFEEYRLPVGVSDQWMTALAGVALAEAGPAHPAAGAAAERAADWLLRARSYPAGWGFNAHTGPDADSTAWALQLLSAVGRAAPRGDVEWLLARRRPCGGFATYPREDGWGEAHVDVTPMVFFSLPRAERDSLGESLRGWTLARRSADGSWPSYWWRSGYYSTYWNLRLLRALGHEERMPLPRLPLEDRHAVHSYFDLAYLVGILQVGCGLLEVARGLGERLIRGQRADGGWEGSDDLRVTDPRYRQPDEASLPDDRSRLYRDLHGITTTATAIRILWALQQNSPEVHKGIPVRS